MQFSDASARSCFADSESPSNATLVPRYVNSATSSMSVPFIVIGSGFELFIRRDFVLVELILSPIFPAFLARSSLLLLMSL